MNYNFLLGPLKVNLLCFFYYFMILLIKYCKTILQNLSLYFCSFDQNSFIILLALRFQVNFFQIGFYM
jgi:hypothetical protein